MEIGNLQEPLVTFVNPFGRFQEAPRSFAIKHFITLKWHPKIKGGNRKFLQLKRLLFSAIPILADQKGPHKIGWDSPFKCSHF